jgi:ABC-type molybdate transport system substrate-binding protein
MRGRAAGFLAAALLACIAHPAAQAVLRDAKHPDAARAFVDFLKGGAARAIFVQYGFRPVPH